MNKKIGTMLAILALLAVPAVLALSTTTQVDFNIETVVAYTLTLPGEGAVTANSTGAPTTAIEFNSTTGTETNLDPNVVGGTAQSSGVPIFQFDNTGTTNLNISVVLDSDTPSCINMTGATTFSGADTGNQITSLTNSTVVNDFTPAAGAQDWYMKVDMASCTISDTTTRTLTSYGIQS